MTSRPSLPSRIPRPRRAANLTQHGNLSENLGVGFSRLQGDLNRLQEDRNRLQEDLNRLQEDRNRLQEDQLQELRQRLETIETNLVQVQQLMVTEQNRRTAAERGAEEAQNRLTEFHNGMERMDVEMIQLKTTINELQNKLETRRAATERRVEEAESHVTELQNVKAEISHLASQLETVSSELQRRKHELEEDSNRQRNELQTETRKLREKKAKWKAKYKALKEQDELKTRGELNRAVEEVSKQQTATFASVLTSALERHGSIIGGEVATLKKVIEEQQNVTLVGILDAVLNANEGVKSLLEEQGTHQSQGEASRQRVISTESPDEPNDWFVVVPFHEYFPAPTRGSPQDRKPYLMRDRNGSMFVVDKDFLRKLSRWPATTLA